MAPIPGLSELEKRKRELLLTSELNRQLLRLEAEKIRLETTRLTRGWSRQAWTWAAPLAGFLFARKFKNAPGTLAKGSLLISALTSLWKVWQALRRKTPGPGDKPAS